MHRHLRFLLPLWLLALLATALSVGAGPAQAATTTTVTVDGSQGGRTFDGIGAISGGATADGSPVEIYDRNGTAAQQWRVRDDGAIVNTGSGKCLDAVGHGTADSTALDIWTRTGGANQVWRRA